MKSALEDPTDIRIFAHPNGSLREQISVHPNDIPHEQIAVMPRATAVNGTYFGNSNRLGYVTQSLEHGESWCFSPVPC